MIDLLKERINPKQPVERNFQEVREALQLMILKALHDRGRFGNVAFVGGTALRILYDLKRFSEDLDFSLVNKRKYDFETLVSDLENDLGKYGLKAEGEPKISKTVHQVMIRFPGILEPLGLSSLKSQKIFIRLEIDSNPPRGWQTELSLVSRLFTFPVLHFDLPSLYATKIHACFYRPFTKGRDYYDLLWYLGRKMTPNFNLLNRAIEQTEGKNPKVDDHTYAEFLKTKLDKVDFARVRSDVERFLEDKAELKYLSREFLIGLVKQWEVSKAKS